MEKVELDRIWLKLRQGDKVFIAEMAGCSKAAVYAFLTGRRNIETELGKSVLKIAREVVKSNEHIRTLKSEHKR